MPGSWMRSRLPPGSRRSEGLRRGLACLAARVLVTASWLECSRWLPPRIHLPVPIFNLYKVSPILPIPAFSCLFSGFRALGGRAPPWLG
jgi:hypothetical protein